MAPRQVIEYARARAIVEKIVARCAADGKKPVAVAVVDDRGDLVAFGRMDGVSQRSLRLAQDKAYTSALQESATKDFAASLERAKRTTGAFADARYVALAGGVPIVEGGVLLGAVGVSGRAADEDDALAREGIGSLNPPA